MTIYACRSFHSDTRLLEEGHIESRTQDNLGDDFLITLRGGLSLYLSSEDVAKLIFGESTDE